MEQGEPLFRLFSTWALNAVSRYSFYKYGGQQGKEVQGVKRANNDFGARKSLFKYDGPEKGEGKDRTFHRVNSINARQSIYKNREEKLEKYKTNEKAVETKAQTVSAPQEKSDDISDGLDAFNISIGGDKGRQEYKVSANKSRQRRRKIGLRTNVVEKEEARRESEEMRRVGELVRRRLGEELRRIFREELEGKTENILEEEKQDEGEEKERSRNQSRRKGEDELDQNSIETVRPLSSAGLLVAPQITIRKRLTLPLNNNNKMDEGQTDGSRQQEAEARSDVDVEEEKEEAEEEEKEEEDEEEAERQKYFRMLWSLRQARVSARLRKGRNGAHQNRLMHQNVQKKHQHQRRYQQHRGNGQKKQKYDTGARRRIGQNSLDGTEVS